MEDCRMPEETVKMVALFDFFGDTLTEKQRVYFDLYYNEDLSLAEIAENYGVTRQGVYDTLSRACASLNRLEEKTGAVRRFGELRDGLAYAYGLAERLAEYPDAQERHGGAARELVSALGELKGKVS
jgi:predicted DNA-binding protein YlxM (UPF0122 family)